MIRVGGFLSRQDCENSCTFCLNISLNSIRVNPMLDTAAISAYDIKTKEFQRDEGAWFRWAISRVPLKFA
jgi:hypothetical protein